MTKNQWFISIKKHEGDPFDLSNLKHNYPPEGMYWADPFLWQQDGIDYVFYELYDYKKGVIAYSIINEDMSFSEPKVIMDYAPHLSYPFLFEDNGTLYMIPESGQAHHIALHKCVSFPDKWEFDKILVNCQSGDNNIFVDNGRYFMYTTIQPNLRHELCILTAESLHGPWYGVLHQNIDNSRSGGKAWKQDDIIYRACQIGKGGYGNGIQIKAMSLDLENKRYGEKVVHEIKPNWHPELTGTHHIDWNDKYMVIDGKRKI